MNVKKESRMQPAVPTDQGCTKYTFRCVAWMGKVGGVRPPCCTEHLKEILFCADELLTQYGIVHWIDFGTLLGAVRHQAMIPWDYDADISFVDDSPSLIPFLVQLFQDAGFYVTHKPAIPDEIKIYVSDTNSNHIDLYAYRRADDGMLRMKWAHNSENWFFPAHFLEPMEPVTFYGRQFLVPSPIHDFLSDYRYGPHYQIPIRFVGEFSFFFEPKDYTPAVAQLFQELDEIVYIKYKLNAQVQSLPNLPTSKAPMIKPQSSIDDRLARLIRKSYDLPQDERASKLEPFWESLRNSNLLEKRVRRKYNTSLAISEITPAAYLLLHRIAQEKERVEALKKTLAVTLENVR